jgi:hypothetical protein
VKNEKLINYLNVDFNSLVESQKKWAQVYFKDYSKDLDKKSSSEKMMVELNAYIGEILQFYIEDRYRNSNLVTANNINSIIDIGESRGYKFKGPSSATDVQQFYLEVPAITGSSGNYFPDMRYAVNFKNVQLQSTNGVIFEALDDVNFSLVNFSSSLNSKVSKRSSDGTPTHFVLKTEVPVMAGKTITETFDIGDYQALRKINLANKNVLQIISCTDSYGDSWEEVDYLVQDVIFEGVKNFNVDSENVPYLLKIKSVPKRFITKVDPTNGTTSLQFGNGKAEDIGDAIVPDPSMYSLNLKGKLSFIPPMVDPQDFIKTRNLGLAPYNLRLTVRCRVGGGKITNVSANTLNSIVSKNVDFASSGLDVAQVNNTLTSFSSRNLKPIEGGDDAPTIPELKSLILASSAAQGRVNTRPDYISRVLSMPSIFGQIFRVSPVVADVNSGVQLYLLAKDSLGRVSTCSNTMKNNIKNYLSLFTRMNQGIDLLDGVVINIGINYSIVVKSGFNKSEVKFNTSLKVKEYFQINRWQLRQPINLSEIRCLIQDTEGVYSVSSISVVNKANINDSLSYSSKVYDIKGNTRNDIIFCPANAIFEVRYPDIDIKVGAI